MSSRLYLARLTVWLLMMLGGYGAAMAQANQVQSLSIVGGVTSGGSTTICAGTSFTVVPGIGTTAPTTVTNVQFTFGGFAFPGTGTQFNGVFTVPVGTAPGSYTINALAQFSNGTFSTFGIPVTLAPASAQLSIAGQSATAICVGTPVTFTTTPGSLTINSVSGPSATTLLSSPSTVTLTGIMATAGPKVFVVNSVDVNGCTSTASVTVTVEVPSVTLVSSQTALNCSTNFTSFTALTSGASSFSYSYSVVSGASTSAISGTSLTGSTGTFTAPVNAAGTAVISTTVTTGAGCFTTTTLSIPYNTTLPTGPTTLSFSNGGAFSLVAGPALGAGVVPVTVCQNTSAIFSVSGCEPTASATAVSVTVIGSGSGTGVVVIPAGPGVTNFIVSTTAVGVNQYYFACLSANGCTSPDRYTANVTVIATPPDPIVNAVASSGATTQSTSAVTGSIAICQGQSLTLTLANCNVGNLSSSAVSGTATGPLGVTTTLPGSGTASQFIIGATNTFTATPGTYAVTLSCSTVNGCVSINTATVNVTIFSTPANVSFTTTGSATGFVVTNSTSASIAVCQSASGTITLRTVACPTGTTLAATGTNASSFSTSGTSTITFPISNTSSATNYQVVCINTVTGCESLTPSTFAVTVLARPANVSLVANSSGGQTASVDPGQAGSISICQGQSLTINLTNCAVTNIPVNVLLPGVLSGTAISVGIGGPNSTTTANMVITSAVSSTLNGLYTVAFSCSNVNDCTSPTATTLAITVNTTPTAPTLVAGSSPSTSGSFSFATGGVSGSAVACATDGGTLTLRTATCSTGSLTAVGTASINNLTIVGTTITIPITASTAAAGQSYSVACVSAAGCQGPATPFSVTVNARPANPIATFNQPLVSGASVLDATAGSVTGSIIVCQYSLLSLTVTNCSVAGSSAAGAIAGGTTPISSISGSSPTSASVTTYTLLTSTTATDPTTYTINCVNTVGGCPSVNSIVFGVTVIPTPAGPTYAVLSNGVFIPNPVGNPANKQNATVNSRVQSISVCQGTSLVLSLSGCSPATNSTPIVITGPAGATVTGTQTSGNAGLLYTLPTSATGTFSYVGACLNSNGCSSTATVTINVNVSPTPGNAGVNLIAPTVLAIAPASAGSITVCEGESIIGNVTGCGTITLPGGGVGGATSTTNVSVGGVGGIVSTGGSFTAVAPNLLANQTTGSVTYTVVCTQIGSTTCSSPQATSINVTILKRPTTGPTAVSLGVGGVVVASVNPNVAVPVCPGTPVSLSVAGCSQLGNGTSQGAGPGFVVGGTYIPSNNQVGSIPLLLGGEPTGTYIYTVVCVNANGCTSTGAFSISLVVETPAQPTSTGYGSQCGNAPAVGLITCPVGQFVVYRFAKSGDSFFPTGPESQSTLQAGNPRNFNPIQQGLNYAGEYTLIGYCTYVRSQTTCLGAPLVIPITSQFADVVRRPDFVQAAPNFVCPGGSTILKATCITGTPSWSSIVGNNATFVGSGTSVTVNGIQTATLYQANCISGTCTGNNGGPKSTAIAVGVFDAVNTVPSLQALPNPASAGQAVTLTGAGCPAGTNTVFYVQGTSTQVGVGTGAVVSVIVNPLVTTIYDAVCTNGVCTSNRSSGIVVTVGTCNFVATATPTTSTLCPGGSVVLTASGGVSYFWNNGAQTQQITATAPGVYNVVVTSAQGCTASATATVVQGFAPVPTISGNTNIIQGQTATLTASGGVTYLWSTGAITPTISTQTAGVYSVTVTGAGGCTAVAQVTVSVQPLPAAPTVTPGTNLNVCLGGNVLLVAQCATGQPRFNRGPVSFNQPTFLVESPVVGTVNVNVVCVVNGVEGNVTPVAVTFNAAPNVAITGSTQICRDLVTGQITGATLTASGATSYLWSNGATTPSITVTTPGLYSVTGTTAGCTGIAQVTTTSAVCGVATPIVITGASINCATREITITTSGGNGQPVERMIQLVTLWVPAGQPLLLDAALLQDANNSTVQLYVRQANGNMAGPFAFNFRTTCPANGVVTPPPTSTTTATGNTITVCGNPYVLNGTPFSLTVGFQCNPGLTPHVINFIPSGGVVDPNSVIEFMSIGITPWTQSCSETFDLNNTDNNQFTINARQRNTQTGAILATTQISVTSPCVRKDGAGREATTEKGELDVTVLGNPTLGDKVEVEVRGAEGQRLQLRMTNGQGASISEVAVENAGTVERQTIGLGRSAGMYFLQVITPTKVKTVKVVRQ